MFRRIRKSKYRWLWIAVLLSSCSGHPDPPKPTGAQLPGNPALWDYHGNEIFPLKDGGN